MLGSSNGKRQQGPNEVFWTWFQEHADTYRDFIRDKHRDMRLYKRLIAELAKVDQRVSPEVTMDDDGTGVLVLTCNGMKEAADQVIAIAEAAPAINGWRVQRFRPPGGEDMDIEMPGVRLAPKDVQVAYALDKQHAQVHIALLLPGYKEEDIHFKQVAFLLLDHSIGEYNTMMHVGVIEFGPPEKAPRNAKLISLDELRKMIEREFY